MLHWPTAAAAFFIRVLAGLVFIFSLLEPTAIAPVIFLVKNLFVKYDPKGC